MTNEKIESGAEQRDYWTALAARLAEPVLVALANRQLRESMPVESKQGDRDRADRAQSTHLEAMGRLLTGLAPWLELGADDSPESEKRLRFADLARRGLDAATDPQSPDRMNFGCPRTSGQQAGPMQALVDCGFLAQALLRAPSELWTKLPERVQDNLIAALMESRDIAPPSCNWLLFSATVEAALAQAGRPWDAMRVDYAIRQHAVWYAGDGVYGDGPSFHWDYYNSFVIQPMLLQVLRTLDPEETGRFGLKYSVALARASRYAAVLERLISPEGAFPPIGRSLTYRIGVLQGLAQAALLHALPEGVTPAQVRCATTAVARRLMDAPGTFDSAGWLRIGFCGAQPALGEGYISTGSLYLCAAGLLSLGLPAADPYWSEPAALWTSQIIYAGEDGVAADHAI